MDKSIPVWIHVGPDPQSGRQLRQALEALGEEPVVSQFTSGPAALARLALNEGLGRVFRPLLITVDMEVDDGRGLEFLVSLREGLGAQRPPVVVLDQGLDLEPAQPYPLGVSGCAARPRNAREWAVLAHGLLELYGDAEKRCDSSASAFFDAWAAA